MTHFFKTFLSFWHFDERSLEKVLKVEAILAQRRIARLERQMALLRIKHAEAVSRAEQIEHEHNWVVSELSLDMPNNEKHVRVVDETGRLHKVVA